MDTIISMDNINFAYGKKEIFSNLSLSINKGEFVTIIGPNGSGKSTLIRILLGFIKSEGTVTINDLVMNSKNSRKIISKIGVVFENPDDQFVAETVMDDIAFSLENLRVKPSEIKKKIKEVVDYLDIEYLLNREPHTLSGGEKQLVSLASALVIDPDIIILDEALTMIDVDIREQIYKILKELNKEKNITIINVTHDMDETLYGDRLIVIDKGNIILDGKTSKVLLEEKKFNKLGLTLPFLAELSIKLKYYGLVDEMILDMDEMVDKLWK